MSAQGAKGKHQEENKQMKPISDKLIDALEDAASEGVKQIKALFAYQGSDRRYFEKGKVAAPRAGKDRPSFPCEMAGQETQAEAEPTRTAASI
jgi:hypothetical protein